MNAPAPVGAAHAALRQATGALHARLDAAFDPAALAARPGYIRFLLGNWPIAPIELALAEAGIHRLLPDWPARERRHALRADLAALGAEPPATAGLAIAGEAATLLGWAYVLEGSRLGARQILRGVEGLQDPEIRAATRFLRHGAGGGLWHGFRATLAGLDADPAAIGRASSAACQAFSLFLAAAPDFRQ